MSDLVTPVQHLFRLENPNIHNMPDGVIWHEDVQGQWFFDDIACTRGYIRQVTTDRSKREIIDGTQLVIAHVPAEELENYRAEHHPVASKLQFDKCDFIIPRDGSVDITNVGIDWLIDALRFQQNRANMDEAQRRIATLSKYAVSIWEMDNLSEPA